jgi:hypothetical protein
MARKKYRASELVAGKTIFISSVRPRRSGFVPIVTEHLIGSENDPVAEPWCFAFYRLPPSLVLSGFGCGPIFKTRRAALADANAWCKRFNHSGKGHDV